MSETGQQSRRIVVTGANGLVGAAVCHALVERGAAVRALVRRGGTAPVLEGVHEHVGDLTDPDVIRAVCTDADAFVHTVHPMGEDDAAQQRAVEWATGVAQGAREAQVPLFVHVSSTAVYEREADTGDVDENSTLAADTANIYAVTKRDTDLALTEVEGMTRVIVRPTAILGPGSTSVWNTVRPRLIRTDASARTDDPNRTFGWVHVRDLAGLIADLATGRFPFADDPSAGPVEGGVTAVNAVSGCVPMGEYLGPVARAVGVEPVWETREAFRARLRAERARAWGWAPRVTFEEAMEELTSGLADSGGHD